MAYTMMGKVGMIEVRGELPRVGDILVHQSPEDGKLTRFRVREVQTVLQPTALPRVFITGRSEVHVDLID